MTLAASTSAEARAGIARQMTDRPALPPWAPSPSRSSSRLAMAQASNPSERWKWDFLFQDMPPVKFEAAPSTRAPRDSPCAKID